MNVLTPRPVSKSIAAAVAALTLGTLLTLRHGPRPVRA